MTIAIHHNGDGSFTVTCGNEVIIVPANATPTTASSQQPPGPFVPTPYAGGYGGVVASIVSSATAVTPVGPSLRYCGSLDLLTQSTAWQSLLENVQAGEASKPTLFTIDLDPKQQLDMATLAGFANELPQGSDVQWQIALKPPQNEG